jgi:hypothetical protein
VPDDLAEFKKIISHIPIGASKHFHVIAHRQNIQIVKARFFCRYLKGSSLRIIYAYYESKKHIEFIELYFKGNKPNEDYDRIEKYIKDNT